MTAIEYLRNFPRSWIPANVERGGKPASNSDLKRWLNMSAIIINGVTPKPNDEISFPITELIFFPKGKRKATIWLDQPM